MNTKSPESNQVSPMASTELPVTMALEQAKDRVRTLQHLTDLAEAAKPLVNFLRGNYDPHTTIVLQYDRVTILQDRCSTPLS